MTALADLITERMAALDLPSLRRVSQEADKTGHQLSPNTLSRIVNGRHQNLRPHTIDAIAAVLRVPASRVRFAAGLAALGEEWTPPPEAQSMSYTQRRLVEGLIREFAAMHVRDPK